MGKERHRFECLMDPVDLWMVWDNRTEFPAEMHDLALTGLEKGLASRLCQLLNQVSGPAEDPDRGRLSATVIPLPLGRGPRGGRRPT